MTTYTADKLYQWLPTIYRIRDAEKGYPLQTLLEILAEQAGVVEDDIAQLYDNWFIETCDEWVVPYLGDLLGVRLVHPLGKKGVYSLRAYVANTLAYRRRKGTAAALEQLAHDLTGWPARAVEFFQLLSTTQQVNHIRPANVRTPDLRDTDALELLGTPFQNAAHSGEVRRIARQRGKYNIPNVGLFLWRLQSYAVHKGTPRPADDAKVDGCYRFNPFGRDTRRDIPRDIPLFNRSETESTITHLAEEVNVPGPLRRRPLFDELKARRTALELGKEPTSRYFGEQPVLQVFLRDRAQALTAEEIVICNLDGWDDPAWKPPEAKSYSRKKGPHPTYWTQMAVDPVLGRLVSLKGGTPVAVSYCYGFSSDVGGGPYDRQDSLPPEWLRHVTWQRGVSRDLTPVPGVICTTFAEAVQTWNSAQPARGLIAILDSHTYDEKGVPVISIPAGSELMIAAAGWPEVNQERTTGRAVLDELCPHLKLDLSVQALEGGKLLLNGLWIEGQVSALPGSLSSLELAHCTLFPGQSGLAIGLNERMSLVIERSIVGGLVLPQDMAATLRVVDSVVQDPAPDPTKALAINAPAADTEVQSSTILGDVHVRSLQASSSIFTGLVEAKRTQVGCIRFSYLRVITGDAQALQGVPRRYRCQPDWAVQKEIEAALELKPALSTPEKEAIAARVKAWLYPTFTTLQFGQPAYAQLHTACPIEIRAGAEDEAEMGVFRHLQQPQREANLQQALEEYLRFGLEAGILYVT